MARKEPDEPIRLDELRGGLKHNPFAALRPRATEAGSGEAPVARTTSARSPEPTAPVQPVVRPASNAPAHDRIVVRRERKGHGGKAVTIAEGPGLAAQDVTLLAREAARALGAGARVEDGALVVQGEQTERLIAWLAARGLGSVVRGN